MIESDSQDPFQTFAGLLLQGSIVEKRMKRGGISSLPSFTDWLNFWPGIRNECHTPVISFIECTV
jgi:hypothetical protein